MSEAEQILVQVYLNASKAFEGVNLTYVLLNYTKFITAQINGICSQYTDFKLPLQLIVGCCITCDLKCSESSATHIQSFSQILLTSFLTQHKLQFCQERGTPTSLLLNMELIIPSVIKLFTISYQLFRRLLSQDLRKGISSAQ